MRRLKICSGVRAVIEQEQEKGCTGGWYIPFGLFGFAEGISFDTEGGGFFVAAQRIEGKSKIQVIQRLCGGERNGLAKGFLGFIIFLCAKIHTAQTVAWPGVRRIQRNGGSEYGYGFFLPVGFVQTPPQVNMGFKILGLLTEQEPFFRRLV